MSNKQIFMRGLTALLLIIAFLILFNEDSHPAKFSSQDKAILSSHQNKESHTKDPKEAAFALAVQRYQRRKQAESKSGNDGENISEIKDLHELTRSNPSTKLLNLIRIPKAGSSSMSAIARALVGCHPDGYACCAYPGDPPGSCPLEGLMCPRVKGCAGHNANFRESPEIVATIISLREPVQRMISGWFYVGIHRPKPDSDHSWEKFEREYAGTTTYSNAMVKMLNEKQPYHRMEIDERHVKTAKDRLCSTITWFSLAREFELPAALLLYETDIFRQLQPNPLVFGLPANYTMDARETVASSQHRRNEQQHQRFTPSGTRVNEDVEYSNWKAEHLANATELMKRSNAADLEVYAFALKLLAARIKDKSELVSIAKTVNDVIAKEIDELLARHWSGTVQQLCAPSL